MSFLKNTWGARGYANGIWIEAEKIMCSSDSSSHVRGITNGGSSKEMRKGRRSGLHTQSLYRVADSRHRP